MGNKEKEIKSVKFTRIDLTHGRLSFGLADGTELKAIDNFYDGAPMSVIRDAAVIASRDEDKGDKTVFVQRDEHHLAKVLEAKTAKAELNKTHTDRVRELAETHSFEEIDGILGVKGFSDRRSTWQKIKDKVGDLLGTGSDTILDAGGVRYKKELKRRKPKHTFSTESTFKEKPTK
jgi:hypothetical protein